MTKRTTLTLLLIVITALALVACQPNEADVSPTEEPEESVPTTEPTNEPTEEPAPLDTDAEAALTAALTAHPWQWVAFTSPVEEFAVESPASYLLMFNEDGTLSIIADCNNALGDYTAGDGDITIEIGPATLALCPGDSRGEQFISLLGGAAIYFFEGGNLFIDLMADGGTMQFAPTDEAAMAADDEGAMTSALLANDWQWVSFTNPVEQFEVEIPEIYRLRFLDDGTISVTADCNNALLPFTDEAGSLSVEVGPTTLALCPGDSRSEQFVALLGGAARYFFEDGNLFIDLMADGGTMEFAPVPTLELTSTPWLWLRFTGNSGEYDVEMPLNYILTFNEDGSVALVADCNNASGEYTDEAGNLNITVGPSTRALCPDDSRSEEYIQLLESAERYFIEGDNLFIVVEEDSGTMSFGSADAAATETALIASPLLDNPWQWVSFTNPTEQFEVTAPESYVLSFYEDGSLLIEADCDIAFASFATSEEGSLAITVGPTTLALCPGDSRAEQFIQLLDGATGYFFTEDNLFIDLMADGGTLELAPIPVPPDVLTESPWQWSSFTGPTEQFEVAGSENYGLSLYEDNTFLLTADCNVVLGDFTFGDDGTMSFTLGPATLAVCPGESRSEQLIELLGSAARYFVEEGNLYIELMADGGTLEFTPVPPPE